MKPLNPYLRLRASACGWARAVITRKRIGMWHYPKDKLHASWRLDDLSERVRTADQLGYDVQLRWDETVGLQVEYVERIPWPPAWY